ncbi:relaxase/mobilization nuclease domain-containing protein [Mesorhizobium australicum]|uniref:Type IV secretory pathway, VirD2 components (Relaxase) n=1 Tax=Mesorhizobium australicum TaxID=536018 RepID=A0A1X7MXR7_9HYPH|nr:VirD2 family relaxase/mobilization nuclease [Mesorhizobium australicum]SMH29681.1 Type IV secretory pathway, VirD2 components (relaxase) [Mesorhizobium australicum]
MSDEREFRVRSGRIRSSKAQRARPFVAQALAAAQKAGGSVSRQGRIGPGNRSRFGRGQRASVQANRLLTARSRGAVIKARVVRMNLRGGNLPNHLSYLRREGVTRDGEKAQLFGPGGEDVDAEDFAERCKDDRHHFRFIVSPDDVLEMADLESFTRDLVDQMEKDLGTRLEWAGIAHWNTEHPHVHLILRGVRDDGENLVISRDYIKEGMRDRARDLITQELGPRTDQDIRHALERQVEAERWTSLDRQLKRDGLKSGFIDLAPRAGEQPDEYHALKVGRLRTLEIFGVAHQAGHSQWFLSDEAEATMRQMGERGDIIKRMHRALSERGIDRGAASFVLAGESIDQPVIGRLVERGLDDELNGTAYAVIEGVDGRTHHVRLPDLEASGDSAPGSIVELRKFEDAKGRQRVAIAVRSDLPIERQVSASGATWLDRQAVSRDPVALGEGGFGREVKQAIERRAEHLVEEGLAQRQGGRVIFARRLLETLRRREVEALGEKLASDLGRPFSKAATGEFVAGTYRQRFALASGRFAMIDDGLGFQLVPWTPSLEKKLGQHISGIARGGAGVDWSFDRKKRGLGM